MLPNSSVKPYRNYSESKIQNGTMKFTESEKYENREVKKKSFHKAIQVKQDDFQLGTYERAGNKKGIIFDFRATTHARTVFYCISHGNCSRNNNSRKLN